MFIQGCYNSNSDLKKEMEVLFYTCMYQFDNLLVYLLSSIILHYIIIHDVIRDVERKKERKKERHLRQWKNEK